jgi:hypothetical protein
MGFSLPAVISGEDAMTAGRKLLEERVAPVDRARFKIESERLGEGQVSKFEYRVLFIQKPYRIAQLVEGLTTVLSKR